MPQSEGGFARYVRSTIAYGPLLRFSGRTPLLRFIQVFLVFLEILDVDNLFKNRRKLLR